MGSLEAHGGCGSLQRARSDRTFRCFPLERSQPWSRVADSGSKRAVLKTIYILRRRFYTFQRALFARAGSLGSHFSAFPARPGANVITGSRFRVQKRRIERELGCSVCSKKGFWGRRKWPQASRIQQIHCSPLDRACFPVPGEPLRPQEVFWGWLTAVLRPKNAPHVDVNCSRRGRFTGFVTVLAPEAFSVRML